MPRAWLALAVLFCSLARGQAPSYSAASVVNAVGFSPGPFAPNSVVSIFGSNLCFDSGLFTNSSRVSLPTSLDYVSVLVDNKPAPLLMVSQGQINFIIPSDEIAGDATIEVVRQGVHGTPIEVALAGAAPTLFPATGGYVIAEDWNDNYAVITPQNPAHSGDTIVLFATGLGAVDVELDVYAISALADPIVSPSNLKVLLNGTAIDASLIKYAGETPGYAGLYQINLVLPAGIGSDPTIQLAMGNQSSQAGLKLAVQ